MAAALLVAYKTAAVIAAYAVYLRLRVAQYFLFGGRNYRVNYGYGYGTLCRILKAGRFDIVKHYRRFTCTVFRDTAVDYFTELFLADLILNNIIVALNKIGRRVLYGKCPLKVKSAIRIAAVNKAEVLRYRLIEDYKADSTPNKSALSVFTGDAYSDRCVKSHNSVTVSHYGLVLIPEYLIGALFVRLYKGKIV